MVTLSLLTAGLSFLLLTFTFSPLEHVYPANKTQGFFRPAWLTDLMFFLGQHFVWSGVSLFILSYARTVVGRILPVSFLAQVSAQPHLLQAVEIIVLGDFCLYWFHRFQHHNETLWKFHSIHHSAEHLDWLAGFREHPVDGLIMQFAVNLPAMLLGFPLETIGVMIAFRGAWASFIHSNVDIKLGPLKYLIGAPELHHWHHAKERDCGNFANLSPMMDVFFGTFRCPDHEPEEFGTVDPLPPGYLEQLAYPFTTRPRSQDETRSTPK